jgi:hypothetical protein
MAYWNIINGKLTGEQMGHDAGMRRLVKARMDLKHGGILPHQMTIEMARATLTGFLEDTTPLIFGIEFNAISMANLVACEAARNCLEEAPQLMRSGQLFESAVKCGLAFAHLMDDYGERMRAKYGYDARFFSAFHRDRGSRLDALDKMVDRIYALEEDLRIMSSELDYRSFRKFRFLVPTIVMTHGGDYQVIRTKSQSPTLEECRFCFDFVIDSAIRLQEFDYDGSTPPDTP